MFPLPAFLSLLKRFFSLEKKLFIDGFSFVSQLISRRTQNVYWKNENAKNIANNVNNDVWIFAMNK